MEFKIIKSTNRFTFVLRKLNLISYDTWWYFDENGLIYRFN